MSVRLPDDLIEEIDQAVPRLECGGETTKTRGTAIRYLIRLGLRHMKESK